jgi:hypothetical protein
MANAILAFPNWLDASPRFATIVSTGGLWSPDLPFSNVFSPILAKVARSIDANPQHTRRWIDLGTLRDTLICGFPFASGSKTLQWRLRCFETWLDEDSAVLGDTGWADVFGVIYPEGTLPNWHPSFTDGRLTAEDLSVYPVPAFHVFDTAVVGRYWLLEFDDSGSAQGYIDLPRLFFAPGWQPTINMGVGATIGYEDRSIVQEALGGTEFFEVLEGRRVVRFRIDYLPQNEALTWALDMQRRLGIHGDAFFTWDPSDLANRHRFSFMGRLRSLSPVEAVTSTGYFRPAFEIAEIL